MIIDNYRRTTLKPYELSVPTIRVGDDHFWSELDGRMLTVFMRDRDLHTVEPILKLEPK